MKTNPAKLYSIQILLLLLLIGPASFSQLPFKLQDGRAGQYCGACQQTIQQMPADVMFAIIISGNDDIYFSLSDKQWFDRIFKGNSYGISIDLVSKTRYDCNKDPGQSLPRGTMIPPIYRADILKNDEGLMKGQIYSRVGTLPASLHNKEIEGNLVILNGNQICYYTNFLNIERTTLALLPTGLFTDSLLKENKSPDGTKSLFTYSRKMQLSIPFAKGSAEFSNEYLRKLYDSAGLGDYRIRKIELRAYSSVEGPEKTNISLMNKRAESMVKALRSYAEHLPDPKIIIAENWLDFYNDIASTSFRDMAGLSKEEIKQKLTDRSAAASLEPVLAKERKVLATVYLEKKSIAAATPDAELLNDLQKSIIDKNVEKARAIQKELAERIVDKRLPADYMSKTEVPRSKEFSPFLNDREVYKFMLRATDEYNMLNNLLGLKKLDPQNGRLNYNICALRFFTWQYGGDTLMRKTLLNDINGLQAQGIPPVLVKRMLINYYILLCEDHMRSLNYKEKDKALNNIRVLYKEAPLNDEDIYSLAKYYAFYSHIDWAEEIIAPRIDKTDVQDDLVFYYLNLLFFRPAEYNSQNFHKATLNAVNLDRKRYCRFFNSYNKGGAGMQLLESPVIMDSYCEDCKQ